MYRKLFNPELISLIEKIVEKKELPNGNLRYRAELYIFTVEELRNLVGEKTMEYIAKNNELIEEVENAKKLIKVLCNRVEKLEKGAKKTIADYGNMDSGASHEHYDCGDN